MTASYSNRHLRVRLSGLFFLAKDTRRWPLLFSQRNNPYSIQLGWLYLAVRKG